MCVCVCEYARVCVCSVVHSVSVCVWKKRGRGRQRGRKGGREEGRERGRGRERERVRERESSKRMLHYTVHTCTASRAQTLATLLPNNRLNVHTNSWTHTKPCFRALKEPLSSTQQQGPLHFLLYHPNNYYLTAKTIMITAPLISSISKNYGNDCIAMHTYVIVWSCFQFLLHCMQIIFVIIMKVNKHIIIYMYSHLTYISSRHNGHLSIWHHPANKDTL